MKFLKACVLLVLVFFVTTYFIRQHKNFSFTSSIVTTSDIAQVLHYNNADKDALFVFDVDRTLLESSRDFYEMSVYEILSDYCKKLCKGDEMVESLIKKMSLGQAINKMKYMFYDSVAQKLIDPSSVMVVRALQKNHPVIVLTARSAKYLQKTIDELQDFGIDMSAHAYKHSEFLIPAPRKSVYKDGVICSGHNDKGVVLESFLKEIHQRPSSIIFVDDKMHNITAVQKAARRIGIPYIGIHYTAARVSLEHGLQPV